MGAKVTLPEHHDCAVACRVHPDGILHALSRPYPPGDPDAMVATDGPRGQEHWFEHQLTTFPKVGNA